MCDGAPSRKHRLWEGRLRRPARPGEGVRPPLLRATRPPCLAEPLVSAAWLKVVSHPIVDGAERAQPGLAGPLDGPFQNRVPALWRPPWALDGIGHGPAIVDANKGRHAILLQLGH